MAFSRLFEQKMTKETLGFVCTTCAREDKTIEAVKYCIECSGYFCTPCIEAHNRFPLMEGHSLMEVTDGNQRTSQQSSLPEFPTERCSIHKGNVVDMYCEDHDVVGCYVCISKDHKTCPVSNIHSVPDMIDTIFKLSECKQTRGLLKEKLLSTESMSKSKESRLEAIANAKQEALGKLDLFQKYLEIILRKAIEASKKDIQEVYVEIEKEILKEKFTLDIVHKDLQAADDKLQQSGRNRAQHFVCAKIAQQKMKQAGQVKTNQNDPDLTLSLIPHQSLMIYMNDLKRIGTIRRCSKLYKIKRRKSITIKHATDSKICVSYGCCLICDSQLLVTDYNNKKLKRIDIQKMSVVDYCSLKSEPTGVCCVSRYEVAVACQDKIQFVSIQKNMIQTKQIEMSHMCYGIAFNDGKMYVTNEGDSLYVYDMTGKLLKTITRDQTGNRLFGQSSHVAFNETGDRMFVGGGSNNGIVCFDRTGKYLFTIKDNFLKTVDGVCVDGRGNVFAVGHTSYNVVQFSERGEKSGMVVRKGDGLEACPTSVCLQQGLDRMFVTMNYSDVLNMYDLE